MNMTLTTQFANGLTGEQHGNGVRPVWLWDARRARIIWANRACLDYCGVRVVDDLRRLRFHADDGFARQLATMADEDLGADGRVALVRFAAAGGRAMKCKCRNHEIEPGRPGLVLTLLDDRPSEQAPEAESVAVDRPSEEVLAASPPAEAVPSYSNGRDRAAQSQARQQKTESAMKSAEPALAAIIADMKLLDKGSEAKTTTESLSDALIYDPAQQSNGYYGAGETADEDDLLALQEIARLINSGGAYANAGVPARPLMATRGEKVSGPALRESEPGLFGDDAETGADARSGASRRVRETASEAVGLTPPPLLAGEKKALLQATHGAERNYFLESLPVAIAISMGGRLMRANEAFLYAFGFGSESELRKAGGLAALFPESHNGVLPLPERVRSHRSRSACIDTQVVSRSGRRRRLPIAFRAISTGREPVQIIVIHEDRLLAEGAEAEYPVSQTPEPAANGADEQKVARDSLDFLAKVSHEVRTPLNSIIGFSELMKDERLGQNDIKKFRGYAEDIHESAMHALSLINDLLDITKIMAGKPELDLEPVDINEIIAASLKVMAVQFEQKQVVLHTQFTDRLPLLLADRRSLRQILLNLVSNAVKFTSSGGRITVSTGFSRTGDVRIDVRDTGIGMRKDQIALALEPFAQLETVLNTHGGQRGTGLGLPLTKALVEAHGAIFVIDSAPAQGTRVSISFPQSTFA